jgi:hypothetical protein
VNAAVAATGLLAANAGFQLALAGGVPWGRVAYGGRVALDDGRLPGRYRLASLATVVVMGLLGWVVLAGGGVVGPEPLTAGLVRWICRGAVLLFALNTLGNLAARSWLERGLMGASTACLTLLFAIVGFG